ncbi:MAG: recombination protein RecR [Deltaproteobacteria bacterium]|nr:recombination protein RecR [Deltaproteobacteria bacterium]
MISKDENALDKLIHSLKQLPGVGEKTATRLAYFILREAESFSTHLAQSIVEARQKLQTCSSCCNFSENSTCFICSNLERTEETICVVEQPSDISALERSRQFKGKYHVLHGVLSPLDGIHEESLKIKELLTRIERGNVREVILATNPTVEGDTTALYIARLIKYNNVRVSRIAYGIPVGSEIEYLDGATLGKALQNRVSL